jgi:glutamyl-tRNA reductase
MRILMVGCNHHSVPLEVRERLAFGSAQLEAAFASWKRDHPEYEMVLLSTCNRIELYLATETEEQPESDMVAEFLCRQKQLCVEEMRPHLEPLRDAEAVRHLFLVASSLDSMVVGEPQILAQVKDAYQKADAADCTGPLTHAVFQASLKVAKRVATETAIHHHRVSIPSIAVVDFALRIFEHLDDKSTLILGAGEMGEETIRYLKEHGAKSIAVCNRSRERAIRLAEQWRGHVVDWEHRLDAVSEADVVVSTTGSPEAILTLEDYRRIEAFRSGRSLFMLDLAVPRDIDPAIGRCDDVFLYSLDDLKEACEENRKSRDQEMPKACRIIEKETERFMQDLHHRATGMVIRQLRQGWQEAKSEELHRLLNKLPELDEKSREEIERSFDRLLNKLLHPPLESLRDEARHGVPHLLMEALSRLFRLKD